MEEPTVTKSRIGVAGPEFNKEHSHCFFRHEGDSLPWICSSQYYGQLWLLLWRFEVPERKGVTKKTRTLAQVQLPPSSQQCICPHTPENHRVCDNNMVVVPHPPYSPGLAPVILLCLPNWKWNCRDDVLKQCLTLKRELQVVLDSIKENGSMVLFKREKMMGSLYMFPRRLFWRRWEPNWVSQASISFLT
jgi:hypothetical protein